MMKIRCSHLSEEETRIEASEKDSWLVTLLNSMDEGREELSSLRPFAAPALSSERSASVLFRAQSINEVILVRGFLKTSLQLLCSRCGNSFSQPYDFSFSTLYSQDPATAGVGYVPEGTEKPNGTNHGFARHAHDLEAESSSELDITYLSTDWIDLEALVAEYLRIETPFQPLCQEDCQGLCSNCGTNLNERQCACSHLKEVENSPFLGLSTLYSPQKKK